MEADHIVDYFSPNNLTTIWFDREQKKTKCFVTFHALPASPEWFSSWHSGNLSKPNHQFQWVDQNRARKEQQKLYTQANNGFESTKLIVPFNIHIFDGICRVKWLHCLWFELEQKETILIALTSSINLSIITLPA